MKIVSIYSTLKIVSIIVQKSAMVLSQIYTPGQKVIHFWMHLHYFNSDTKDVR